MTKEKQTREDKRTGCSRWGRTTNWGERKERAARRSCTSQAEFIPLRVWKGTSYHCASSACKYLKEKVPHLSVLTPTEHSLLLPPASLHVQPADVHEGNTKLNPTLYIHVVPHYKISGCSLYLFWIVRKLHIQKLCQKSFKRLQTEVTNCKETPALGNLYTEELLRSCKSVSEQDLNNIK